MLELDRASAGRMIDRMENGGWLERRPDPVDRRIKRLHLTPHARSVHASLWKVAEATVDDALEPLSGKERHAFEPHGRGGEAPPAGADRRRRRSQSGGEPRARGAAAS